MESLIQKQIVDNSGWSLPQNLLRIDYILLKLIVFPLDYSLSLAESGGGHLASLKSNWDGQRFCPQQSKGSRTNLH